MDAAAGALAEPGLTITHGSSPDGPFSSVNPAQPDLLKSGSHPFEAVRDAAAEVRRDLRFASKSESTGEAVQSGKTKEPALSGGLSRVFTNVGRSLSESEGFFNPKVLVTDSWLRGQDLNL
ncbi:hypothetical protein GCM10009712_32570 [Pseudarthrobacter sulfonivorans]